MKIPEQFDSRLVRVVAGVVAPGAIALVPWLLVVAGRYPSFGEWLFSEKILPTVALSLLVFCVGMICENLGSRIELRLDEKHNAQDESWNKYLNQGADQLVGHRYISSVVTRLKFELGMTVALPLAWFAIILLGFCQSVMPREASALLSAAVILSAFYFYHESDKTVERLAQTRREITAFPVSKQSNESKLQKKSFMGRLLQKRKLPVKQSET